MLKSTKSIKTKTMKVNTDFKTTPPKTKSTVPKTTRTAKSSKKTTKESAVTEKMLDRILKEERIKIMNRIINMYPTLKTQRKKIYEKCVNIHVSKSLEEIITLSKEPVKIPVYEMIKHRGNIYWKNKNGGVFVQEDKKMVGLMTEGHSSIVQRVK